MARLNAVWDNFWNRGQVWYHFWGDTGSVEVAGSFTLDAVVRAPQSASLHLDAVIGISAESGLFIDAVVRAGQSGSFSLDAVTRAPVSASFTVDAIRMRTTSSGLSIDSFILGWLTLDAVIGDPVSTVESSFTLEAMLAVEVFRDDFNRVVPTGLGPGWFTRPDFNHDTSLTSVDGSEVVQQAGTETDYFGLPNIISGLLQFDFYVVDPDDTGFWYGFEWSDGALAWGLEIYSGYNRNGVRLFDTYWSNNYPSDGVPVAAHTWYTCKALVTGHPDGDTRVKIWERGTPEPDWLWSDTHVDHAWNVEDTVLYIDAGDQNDGRLDNIRVWAFEAPWTLFRYFTFDAWFAYSDGTHYMESSFTLDAILKVTDLPGTFASRMVELAPVDWWRQLETAGTTAKDSGSLANDGTYTGAYYLGGSPPDSPKTNGLSVNYQNSGPGVFTPGRIERTGLPGAPSGHAARSFFAFFRTSDYHSQTLIGYGYEGYIRLSWWVEINMGGNKAIGVSAYNDSVGVGSVNAYTDGAWHSLLVTFDGGIPGTERFYVDGSFIGSGSHAGQLYTNTGRFMLAALWWSINTDDLRGDLAEPALFNYQLTQQQLNSLLHPEAGFTLDAVIVSFIGSFTVDAELFRNWTTVYGSFSLDAVIKRTMTSEIENVVDTESVVAPWVAGPIGGYGSSASLSIQTGDQPGGWGSNSLKVTTSGLGDQMAYVPFRGVFRAGVTYTVSFWIKLSGASNPVQWIVGSGWESTSDRALSYGQTITTSWVQKIVHWTPSADRSDAVLAVASWGSGAVVMLIDGVVATPWTGGFSLDAMVAITSFGSFDLEAEIVSFGGSFTVDAWLAGRFPLDAVLLRQRVGSFTIEALTGRGGSLTLDAAMRDEVRGAFLINAVLLRGFRLDAWIIHAPGTGSFTLSAELAHHAFTLDASLRVPGYVTGSFALDADISGTSRPVSGFRLDAWTLRVQKGFFTLDAFILGPTIEEFTLDAQISVPSTPAGAFTLDAQISATHRQFGLTVDAVMSDEVRGAFLISARIVMPMITAGGGFALDAYISGAFTLDAVIRFPTRFTLDAVIHKPGLTFTLNAWIGGRFTLDAEIVNPGNVGVKTFTLNAVTRVERQGELLLFALIRGQWSFTLDAVISRGSSFTLDAFVAGYFTLDAYIRRVPSAVPAGDFALDAIVITGLPGDPGYPGGPGRPGDPGYFPPVPFPATPQPKSRIKITIDGTDVTEHVMFSRSRFTQLAKVGPGTFQISLRGVHAIRTGSEVYLEIDDFRQFGGYALQVARGFVFGAKADPTTIVSGPDFNILFDKRVIYNRARNLKTSGPYYPIPDWPKGTKDDVIIKKFVSDYLDLPDLDTSNVEAVGTANPDTNGSIDNGLSFRQFMQGQSTMTQAVWWISPYLELHNHSRAKVTAPAPVGDGAPGVVSCQNLEITESIDKMVSDSLVWGVLAKTISGEIIYNRVQNDTGHGLWQQFEWHSDIHTKQHVIDRSSAIVGRWGNPVVTATCRIFEAGYQAGMVCTVRSEAFGVEADLVLRQIQISFLLVEPSENGVYYGLPAYDLDLGLDPEEPWTIYDWIPFEPWDVPHFSFWWGNGWGGWIERFNNRDIGSGWSGPADGSMINRYWHEYGG